MSCDITNGRLEACKDSISGLNAIYFINYGIAPVDVTYDTPANPDQIVAIANVTDIYKYELKGNNSLETTIVSSRENGTTYFDQTLTIQLKRQDPATHKNIKMLAYGRPHIIVHTRSNQWFMVGLLQGADVNAGTVSSGSALGDFNGYSLTFLGQEMSPPNFIDTTDEVDLATNVLGGATVHVS